MHPSGAGSMRMPNSWAMVNEPLGLRACFRRARMAFSRAAWMATLSVCTTQAGVSLDQTGAFGFGRFSGGGDLDGAKAADADRFVQRRVEADGRNADAATCRVFRRFSPSSTWRLLLLTRIEIIFAASPGDQAQAVLREAMGALAFHADLDQGVRVVLGGVRVRDDAVAADVLIHVLAPASSSDFRNISTFCLCEKPWPDSLVVAVGGAVR